MSDFANLSDAELLSLIQQRMAPQAPTFDQKVRASAPMRVVQGMRDPVDAGAQLAVRGAEATGIAGPVNRATEYVNNLPVIGPITKALGMVPATSKQVDQGIQQAEQEYEAARKATGQSGVDAWRLAGNVVSPANAAAARLVTIAPGMSALQLAGQGAKAGAVGGLLTPVTDTENFWANKGAQTATGAATGAVLTPAVSKLTEGVANLVNRVRTRLDAGEANRQAERILLQTIADSQTRAEDYSREQLDYLRRQVADSLRSGRRLDPAALLRDRDFQALELPRTGGQISRDPTQFTREKNLSGVEGVGDPIRAIYQQQNQGLQRRFSGWTGNASESQVAGERLNSALARFDEQLSSQVRGAYKAAEQAAGAQATVPLQGLAQDYARVVDTFGTENIPGAVQRRMEQLGLMSGKQTRTFSVDDAEQLLKIINANENPMNRPMTTALGELRAAVKRAVTQTDASGGPFAVPRGMAADRFRLHEQLPALEAASMGTANPDQFVQRYVLNAQTPQVRTLAETLRRTDPAAFQEARNQMGAAIQRAAFGENMAGDKAIAPERLAKALRQFGTQKLEAFFSPQEVQQMWAAARVGSYINSQPAGATVNHSNTTSALINLLGNVPFLGAPIRTGAGLARVGAERAGQQQVLERALSQEIPNRAADMSPERARALAALLMLGGQGMGAAGASSFR